MDVFETFYYFRSTRNQTSAARPLNIMKYQEKMFLNVNLKMKMLNENIILVLNHHWYQRSATDIPIPTPIPPPPSIVVNNSGTGLPGINVLKCVFNVVCNANSFVYDENNENFYNIGLLLLSSSLTTPTSVAPRATPISFNGIDNRILGICIKKVYLVLFVMNMDLITVLIVK